MLGVGGAEGDAAWPSFRKKQNLQTETPRKVAGLGCPAERLPCQAAAWRSLWG